jgi:drug/metabolite transporter (DMT)-like permease
MSDNRRAMLLMIAFAALWAAIEEIASHVLRHYSPYQVVWSRYAVHLMLMLAVWGWREPTSLWRTRRPVFQLARSLLMVGMPVSWIIGTQVGVQPAALMSIFWLSPLFILVLARWFLGDRIPAALWIATLAGCSGSFLLHAPGRVAKLELMVFPIAMALCFSLYVVMSRCLRTEATRANLFYTAFGVFLVLTPVMPNVWITPGAHDMLVLAAIGVLGFFALYMLDRMASAAPVSVSAPFAYLQIALTVGIAIVAGAGGNHSLRRTAVGLLLIAGATFSLWVREPRLRLPDAQTARAVE